MLCTLDDIKTRLGLTAEHDAALTRIIASFKSLAESYTQRGLILPDTDATEYYTGAGAYLQVKSYPLASITSIKEADDYDFDGAAALVLNDDYRTVGNGVRGVLYRTWADWLAIADSIQVIYRGGYAAAGVTPGTGQTALPDDLREAAIEQCSFIFKRRDDIGLSSNSFQGGSINVFASMDLLPLVKQTLDCYRRLTL
jgi:hypothetical protein